jgi:K+-transporting ATPase KdpF subunit
LQPAGRLPKAAREFEVSAMIYATAVITALLFIYLGTALVRPEWF